MILVLPPSVDSTQTDIFSGGSGRRVSLIAAASLRDRQYSTDSTVANALPRRRTTGRRPRGGPTVEAPPVKGSRVAFVPAKR
jgi:hypothetical protein